ncbi:hypothetical protein [Paraburkholderia sp. A3RO-2L]|uniref:hypothetical protein n=1 Tax=unclassified Paraburkholderia TaxID=2615204 RepID=UPI003DA91A8F
MTSISHIDSALERARLPSAVVVNRRLFDPPTLLEHVNAPRDGSGALDLLSYVLKANALRDQMQRQVARAVAVLASPENLNWHRLAGCTRGSVPQKPRIVLWAEFNGRDTLEILAFPQLDAGAITGGLTREVLTARSDYVELHSTWPYYGARGMVVFRAPVDEYVGRDSSNEFRLLCKSGEALLRGALEDSLSYLVQTLASVCDVRIENWPKYTKSKRLDLLSPSDRAHDELSAQLPELKHRRQSLEALIAEKVTRHKLASVAEFEELAAQAARDGVKITALIFAKTGQRCSSIGTDKISALIEEHRELVAQMDQLEHALLALRAV